MNQEPLRTSLPDGSFMSNSIDYEALLLVVRQLQRGPAQDLQYNTHRFNLITKGRLIPPTPFTTDGCTFSPDCDYQCCVLHDLAYWLGGTRADKLEADRRLYRCTAYSSRRICRFYAPIQYLGVRLGGSRFMPNLGSKKFRWGYGWPYPDPAERGISY